MRIERDEGTFLKYKVVEGERDREVGLVG